LASAVRLGVRGGSWSCARDASTSTGLRPSPASISTSSACVPAACSLLRLLLANRYIIDTNQASARAVRAGAER
jgi:hypothetical protein